MSDVVLAQRGATVQCALGHLEKRGADALLAQGSTRSATDHTNQAMGSRERMLDSPRGYLTSKEGGWQSHAKYAYRPTMFTFAPNTERTAGTKWS